MTSLPEDLTSAYTISPLETTSSLNTTLNIQNKDPAYILRHLQTHTLLAIIQPFQFMFVKKNSVLYCLNPVFRLCL